MGRCFNCEQKKGGVYKPVTLADVETRCDDCNKPLAYQCFKCHEWFKTEYTSKKGHLKKRKECTCGSYFCPKCNACSKNCKVVKALTKVEEIWNPCNSLQFDEKQLTEKRKETNAVIEEALMKPEHGFCPKGVKKSYAKGKCKFCMAKIQGYKTRNEKDRLKFLERFEKIKAMPLDFEYVIKDVTEEGTYGQEWKDASYSAVCLGFLKTESIPLVIGKVKKKTIMIDKFKRINGEKCKKLDDTDLFFKECPNQSHLEDNHFDESEDVCPKCMTKAGLPQKLRLKLNNKDSCMLKRGEFIPFETYKNMRNGWIRADSTWEDAIARAKDELGYDQDEWIDDWEGVVQLAKKIQKGNDD